MKNRPSASELSATLGYPSTETVQGLRLFKAFLKLSPSQRSEVALTAVERPIGFLHRADTTLSPVALALRDEILALCIKLGYPLVTTTPGDRASRAT